MNDVDTIILIPLGYVNRHFILSLFSKYVPTTRTDQLPEIGPMLGITLVTVAKLMMENGSGEEARPPIRRATVPDPSANGGVKQTTAPSPAPKITCADVSTKDDEDGGVKAHEYPPECNLPSNVK